MLQLKPKGPDLWDSLIPEEVRKLPEDLAHVDRLLNDARFMEPFARRFEAKTGRPSLPVSTYLRLMYLRRRRRLGYEALVGEVTDSIPLRTFCGIGCQDRVPDPSTLARNTQRYGEEALQELYRLVDEDLQGWKIQRKRKPAAESSGALRPARGGFGPALARLLERTRLLIAAEARALRPAARPSAERIRRVNRKLLRIIRRTALRARRLASGAKPARVPRQGRIAFLALIVCALPAMGEEPGQRSAFEQLESAAPGHAPGADAAPLENLGTVIKGVTRGAKVETEEGFRFLAKDLKVRTVVNLRYPEHDDETLCAKYGLKCVTFGVKITPKEFDYETFRNAFAFTVKEYEAGSIVYFHCTMGSDRTGALAAAITLREKACRNRSYDRKALWAEIDAELKAHQFHMIFRSLYNNIKSWTFQLEDNEWICR